MAKILFVNPVVREEDNPKHIPYGMALLASIAMDKGHLVQVYDANAWRQGLDVLEEVYAADDWDVIAIGGLTTTYGYIKKAVKIAKRVAPKSFIIAGGGFITSMPSDIMNWLPEIDLGVIGESFLTFPDVLAKIDRKDFDFSQTPGVIFRHKSGKSFLTPVRENIQSLDVLPWPAWDLFPLEIYFKNSQLLFSEEVFTSKRRLDINGSIGCSLVCKYCWHLGTAGDMLVEKNAEGENDVVFTYGRNIRYHSPDYIVKMVKHMHDTYQLDFASFIDENLFTMDASSRGKWLLELSRKWIEGGLQPTCRKNKVPHDENCRGVHWGGTAHAGLHKKEQLQAMFDAGCANLVYGLESFAPKILRNLGKGSTRQRNIDSVGICLSTGIRPIPNIIMGFPEEDFSTIRETMTALKELGIHAKPHFATPYPGSEWYYTYKDSILKQYDGNLEEFILNLGDASKISAVICHKFSAMDLIGLQQIVFNGDFRLLDQAEKHWNESDKTIDPVAVPQKSFNLRKSTESTPMEKESRTAI